MASRCGERRVQRFSAVNQAPRQPSLPLRTSQDRRRTLTHVDEYERGAEFPREARGGVGRYTRRGRLHCSDDRPRPLTRAWIPRFRPDGRLLLGCCHHLSAPLDRCFASDSGSQIPPVLAIGPRIHCACVLTPSSCWSARLHGAPESCGVTPTALRADGCCAPLLSLSNAAKVVRPRAYCS